MRMNERFGQLCQCIIAKVCGHLCVLGYACVCARVWRRVVLESGRGGGSAE